LPRSIVAADFDADGDQDLAVGNILSDDITILRNNGSGNFAEAPSSPELVANAVAMVTPTSTATRTRTWRARTRAATPRGSCSAADPA
jgi:FG-GAP repeat